MIDSWIEAEFTARQVWPKDPGTIRPHAAFGGPGLASELPMKGGAVNLRGAITAVSRMGPYAVGHLHGARRGLVAANSADALTDADLLEIGLHLWSLSAESAYTALEVQALEGDRVLYVLPRDPEYDLTARVEKGLRVVDLGERAEFFPRVKALLGQALETVRQGAALATPGDHCAYCDFGEVCRVSVSFGEEGDEFDDEA